MNIKTPFLVGLKLIISQFKNQGPYMIGFIARRLIITLVVFPAALCFGLLIVLTGGKPFTSAAEVYVEALQEYSTYPGIGHDTVIQKVCVDDKSRMETDNIQPEFKCSQFRFESESKQKAIDDGARQLGVSYLVLFIMSFILDVSVMAFTRINKTFEVADHLKIRP